MPQQPGQFDYRADGSVWRFNGVKWEELEEVQKLTGEPTVKKSTGYGVADVSEDIGLPVAGAFIGGKTPLGPVGSAIGAAAGQGYGQISKLLRTPDSIEGVWNAASQEPGATLRGFGEGASQGAKDALTTAAMTLGGETLLPFLKHVPKVPRHLWQALGLGSVPAVMAMPPVGMATAGAAATAAVVPPALRGIGRAAEYMGTPAGQSLSTGAIPGTMSQFGSQVKQGTGYVSDKATQALKGIDNFFNPPAPPPVPAPVSSMGRDFSEEALGRLDEAESFLNSGYSREMAGKLSNIPGAGKSTATRVSHLPQLPDDYLNAQNVKSAGIAGRVNRAARNRNNNTPPIKP